MQPGAVHGDANVSSPTFNVDHHIQCCHCTNCKNIQSFVRQPTEVEQELQEELEENTDTGSECEQSSDEERLSELNRDVDKITEEVFGLPF